MQRTVAGLGLGLFVVRSLVRKQGGKSGVWERPDEPEPGERRD